MNNGDSKFFRDRNKELILSVSKDRNRIVTMISSFHSNDCVMKDRPKRDTEGNYDIIQQSIPRLIDDYNHLMGGVDLFGQKSSYYGI